MKELNKFEIIVLTLSLIILSISTGSNIFNIIIYSLGIIPLSIVIGNCTDEISDVIGDKKGGF